MSVSTFLILFYGYKNLSFSLTGGNIFELKRRLAEIGNIRTPVEFKITVEKDNTVLRPVKPEDKLRFLSKQNSHLASFRKALDIE